MVEESKDSESPGQKNMEDIFKKLEQEQGVVTNNVEDLNDLFENFNQDKFFPRIDDLSNKDNIKEANQYVDKVLQEFVNDYAEENTGEPHKAKDEKIKKIQKENSWPYFIETCRKNGDEECYKDLESANNKFDLGTSNNNSNSVVKNVEDVKVIKYGYESIPSPRTMTFSYEGDKMKIEWTTEGWTTKGKIKIKKNIQTKSIEVDDIINNKLMIMNEKDFSIKLKQKKWYDNNNINVDRNILIRFISDDDGNKKYIEFKKFMETIKKDIDKKNREKVIAADVIRSTMICDVSDFFENIKLFFKFISKMNDGMIGKINNTFHDNKAEALMFIKYYIPYYYYGLNVTFFIKYPKEGDLKDKYIAFEVQFHTEGTYDVKERLHDDYHIQKGFDYLSLPNEEFEQKLLPNEEFKQKFQNHALIALNKKYNEIMNDYYESDGKKELINKIVKNRVKISKEHLHDLLLKSPIIKLFKKDHLKKKNILDDTNFIKLVTDKHNFVYKLSEQISLMKELFILCRCIKNNQLINKNKGSKEYPLMKFDDKEISELVRALNCEKYYGFKSDFLENKYKNPNCNFDKDKKLKDFLGIAKTGGTIIIPVIEKLTDGSFFDDLNEILLKYLCNEFCNEFIDCDKLEQKSSSFLNRVLRKTKTDIEIYKERLVSIFKEVMKYDIGIPPFA